ncbi:MAG: DUF4143 domain-containing protein [bacterium]|nr:DUF4143 domain-containing protein [bacterium]
MSAQTIRKWLSVLKASYITDVGLVAFLLGIHTPEQAARDPLRSALYENLVITEVLKSAGRRGLRPDLSFYRDSHGNEVDLLIRESGPLTPVEIKSAAAFSPNFTKGIAPMTCTACTRSIRCRCRGRGPQAIRGCPTRDPGKRSLIGQPRTRPATA